jgi:AcrR family transcriptional regulator
MDSSFVTATPGRRELQKQDRERRIMSAARRLFERKGYAKTAMEEIAARAGLAVGTLYNYFPSKDDLLLAIMRREADRLMQVGERILADPPAKPSEAIAAMADLLIESITADERMLWRELFAAAISSPHDLGARLIELDMRLVAQLATLLESLKQRGAIAHAIDASRAAMTIYGLCAASALAFVMNESITVEQLREEVNESIRLLVGGMLPPAHKKEKGR